MASKHDIYVAKETFAITHDGKTEIVRAGRTRVRAGHPIMKGREHLFELLKVQFDVETTRQAPGQARKKSTRKRSS